MLGGLLERLRAWYAVEDPEDRIEGSGEPIMSPKHRRNPEAERLLEEGQSLEDETPSEDER